MDAPDRGGAVCQRRAGAREDLARVVGQGASVDLLVEDLAVDLEGRAYRGGAGGRGMDAADQARLCARDPRRGGCGGSGAGPAQNSIFAVLAAIAFHQPITRDGLKDIFGKEISRDLIGRLHARRLIGTGPRSPQRGAPYTFVTTEQFLVAFGLESLRDLPDREQLEDVGLARATDLSAT